MNDGDSTLKARTMEIARLLLGDSLALGASVVLLILLAVIFGPMLPFHSEKDEAKKKPFTHMHCSICQEEYPYNSAGAQKGCLQCGTDSRMIPTVGSTVAGTAEENGSWSWASFVAYSVLALVLTQGFILLCYWRYQVLQAKARATMQQVLVARCPFCERKVGYTRRKIGEPATCVRCKTVFVLPGPDTSQASSATSTTG